MNPGDLHGYTTISVRKGGQLVHKLQPNGHIYQVGAMECRRCGICDNSLAEMIFSLAVVALQQWWYRLPGEAQFDF